MRISLVMKKNGSIRVCIAPIGLNKATINDAHPLPNIWALLNAVGEGCEWITSMDMAARFWQIKVAEEDKYKTAHAILGELYEYNVIPFELKGAPATFQRLMQKVLGKYMWDFVLVYLDDIIIYSKSLKEP